jgi:hypothetical protein
MGYKSWFNSQAKKHKQIVQKLVAIGMKDDEIIEYFDYENMKKNEIDYCPLYAKDKKCHDSEELNCYLCACPNFRFDDSNENKKSYCSIDSPSGKRAGVHQDCSECTLPHIKKFIKSKFSLDWLEIMKDCDENI